MAHHEIRLERRALHGHFSRDLAPILAVDSGDSIAFACLNSGWRDDSHEPFEGRLPEGDERDAGHALLRRFARTVDGQYQTLGAKDGAYNLAHFFQQDPELAALVAHMSDAEIDALKRGGHDLRKLYAAFAQARAHRGQPTVILAKTKMGFGMGGAGESRMTAHQAKKLDVDGLKPT